MTRTVRVEIEGLVQGVFFRDWTRSAAQGRGLDGWVRNRDDGSVEAVFHGDPASVDDMVRACWEGPPHAKVSRVETFAHDDFVEPGFRVLPTG